jgi:hypothetical protein
MDDDVRRVIYGTVVAFLLVVLSWLGFIYISACGFTLTCYQASPLVIRTPIPTLIPVSHPEIEPGAETMAASDQCRVVATELIGAWVTAGYPEADPFPFTDLDGNPCEGTFEDDIQHLFVDNSVWYPGALGCTSCHNAELTERSGGLDLASHAGILAGVNGTDILGDGDWEASTLHDVLLVHGFIPAGHTPDVDPMRPVILYAGQRAADDAEATPTATP